MSARTLLLTAILGLLAIPAAAQAQPNWVLVPGPHTATPASARRRAAMAARRSMS